MWRLAAFFLVFGLTTAEPQRGYDYLPPSIPFVPTGACKAVTSVVYTTSYSRITVPTTILRVNTQYRTFTQQSERVVPTIKYNTQYQTRVQYQTRYVDKESQVVRENVVTQTQQGRDVVRTNYVTSTRIVPQVNYVTRTQYKSEAVPVYSTNIRYQTRYQDQVRYETVPVQTTRVVVVTGRDVVSTVYRTQIQSSLVQKKQPDQTRYATSTAVRNEVQTRTVPSPAVYSTKYVESERIIPTTRINTQFQTRYVTDTRYVTRTQYRTQSQVQTRYQTKEVVVTNAVQREVIRTEYETRVVPTIRYETRYTTQVIPGQQVVSTRQKYETSVVRVPGDDRVVTSQVIKTQVRQQVVYRTENLPRQVTVTQTLNVPCGQTGYKYPEPQIKFNF